MNYKRERTTVARTQQLVCKYLENNKQLDDEFANYIICLAADEALHMKLKLQQQDYDDALMHGVMNIIKYGLKSIEKIPPRKAYYYLLLSAKSGICRFLEKHNKHRKHFVATDFTTSTAANGD